MNTSEQTLYRLIDGFNFDGADIPVRVERYPFRPTAGFNRFQFADILFDPVEDQSMEVSVRIDGSTDVKSGSFSMGTNGTIVEAHKRSVNLGYMGRHAALLIEATINDGVLPLTGNDLQVTGNGLDIEGFTGNPPGFRLNGVNWGYQAARRVSR